MITRTEGTITSIDLPEFMCRAQIREISTNRSVELEFWQDAREESAEWTIVNPAELQEAAEFFIELAAVLRAAGERLPSMDERRREIAVARAQCQSNYPRVLSVHEFVEDLQDEDDEEEEEDDA